MIDWHALVPPGINNRADADTEIVAEASGGSEHARKPPRHEPRLADPLLTQGPSTIIHFDKIFCEFINFLFFLLETPFPRWYSNGEKNILIRTRSVFPRAISSGCAQVDRVWHKTLHDRTIFRENGGRERSGMGLHLAGPAATRPSPEGQTVSLHLAAEQR